MSRQESTPFRAVKNRSGNRCEAMVPVSSRWTRCFREPVEVHHMLTRSRGGLILDAFGETDHLIALCPKHHKQAHAPGGHQAGLMINGYVSTGPDGRPVYEGTYEPLRAKYSPVDVPDLREDLPGHHLGQGLRGPA